MFLKNDCCICGDCVIECYKGFVIIANDRDLLLIVINPLDGSIIHKEHMKSFVGVYHHAHDIINDYLNDHKGFIKVNTGDGAK